MPDTTLFYNELETPVGPLLIISDGENIVRIDYGTLQELDHSITTWGTRYFANPFFVWNPDSVSQAAQELQQYFTEGRKNFSFAFTFHGTAFQQQVWQALYDTIPYGDTRTYQDIAVEIGKPKAVRAVGGAVNKNPFSIVVPCHRVIGANGKMVGYNGGLDKKQYLLEHERFYTED